MEAALRTVLPTLYGDTRHAPHIVTQHDRIVTQHDQTAMPPVPAAAREGRRLPRARVALAILLLLMAGLTAVTLLDGPPTTIELLQAAVVVGMVVIVVLQRRLAGPGGRRRMVRDASFTRILHGLSRSVSGDSVVQAIVEELRFSSGADHVVVARRAEADGTLEVTLVAASASVPASRTLLRPDILGAPAARDVSPTPADPAMTRPNGTRSEGSAPIVTPALRFQEAADEVARRVRSGYGLPHTLAAPLIADARFVGALMLSKRTRDSWSELDRRLLTWASGEVSAALARVYALEEAEARANIDALTGLPNRRYFDEIISIVRPRRRAGDTLGILMIDIDRFKNLNDRYGHATGDTVLRAVAGAIYTTVRAEDTPARYGGEEFSVILHRASAAQAVEVAERVRAAVQAMPPERMGIERPVTVSVGVAVAVEEDIDVAAIIDGADGALYLAKRRGRNRVEVAAGGAVPTGSTVRNGEIVQFRPEDEQALYAASQETATPEPRRLEPRRPNA
ncbi:MAG: sensor domain-containing diguanylate cyclase [Chloroflexota bacterium]|nr:sensor domain-containing diguanylate cyclase [Chloroflexota bacterium]